MLKITLATANPHKVEEINAIIKDFYKDLRVEFVMPEGDFDPVEDGDSFEQNALIKAREAHKSSKMLTLADDSGLCVDALNGLPGLYSARYAGSQEEKIEKLLKELKNVPPEKRIAKFVCAMVLLDKNGEILISTQGECKGKISFLASGENGFGFDPVFIVEGKDKTMAQMSEHDKNTISHRAKALNNIANYLKTF